MYAIVSKSTKLFFAGVVYDNGSYGSGYPLYTFSPVSIQTFNDQDAAIVQRDLIQTEPSYLRLVSPGYDREKLGELSVVKVTISEVES